MNCWAQEPLPLDNSEVAAPPCPPFLLYFSRSPDSFDLLAMRPHACSCPAALIPQARYRSHSPSWWAGKTWAGRCGSCWTTCPIAGTRPSPGWTSPPGSWTAQRQPSWTWERWGGRGESGGAKAERRGILSRSPSHHLPSSPCKAAPRPVGLIPGYATDWLCDHRKLLHFSEPRFPHLNTPIFLKLVKD